MGERVGRGSFFAAPATLKPPFFKVLELRLRFETLHSTLLLDEIFVGGDMADGGGVVGGSSFAAPATPTPIGGGGLLEIGYSVWVGRGSSSAASATCHLAPALFRRSCRGFVALYTFRLQAGHWEAATAKGLAAGVLLMHLFPQGPALALSC
jgi:hypothetical protein